MSTFWSEEEAQTANGEFDGGGGNFEPIPAGTQLIAAIKDAKIKSPKDDDDFIELQWSVLDGEFKNRAIFQKVRVFDQDQKKADKARKMLAAIDANCGGTLVKARVEPTGDMIRAALLGKPMRIVVEIWETENAQTGALISGNWVRSVSPLNSKPAAAPMPTATLPKRTSRAAPGDDEEEVPF